MLTETTVKQINKVSLAPERPVVICDVDEVVVHFIKGLEAFLERNGMWLHPQSFALNGNIKKVADNEPIPVEQLGDCLDRFFDEDVHRLEPIDGAVAALNSLGEQANIVMLTNLPERFHAHRTRNLASLGLDFPVVANEGPKGPAVKALLQDHKAKSVFIDDIPKYLQSVGEHRPDVHLIHFMQDERFGRHIGELDFVSLRSDNWPTVHSHIQELLHIP